VSGAFASLFAQRTINILSRPQIRTLDNQEATIQVGSRCRL
jgi:type II secretory pathway component GspD/PulD (secretin)